MDRTAREKAAGSTTGTTLVRLEGAETLDLLHRISTQDMSDLAPGMARATLFCDFRGRLLHRAIAARTADGAVWLLRDDAGTAELIAYLERFIFRESVRVADRVTGFRFDEGLAGFGAAAALGFLFIVKIFLAFVEEELDYFVETVGQYCPWRARLVAVEDYR